MVCIDFTEKTPSIDGLLLALSQLGPCSSLLLLTISDENFVISHFQKTSRLDDS
jgi:hypothetical protein